MLSVIETLKNKKERISEQKEFYEGEIKRAKEHQEEAENKINQLVDDMRGIKEAIEILETKVMT